MSYFSYHNTAKKLIGENKLIAWYYLEKYNQISPALVLIFDDTIHPVMPIREYRWDEYMNILPEDKRIIR